MDEGFRHLKEVKEELADELREDRLRKHLKDRNCYMDILSNFIGFIMKPLPGPHGLLREDSGGFLPRHGCLAKSVTQPLQHARV